MATMTKEEILNAIKNPNFAVGFAIDNNLQGVIDNLKILGITVNDKQSALQALKSLANGDKQKLQTVFDRTPYINFTPEQSYTGGFKEYFISKTSPDKLQQARQMNQGRFSFDGLLSALGAGLTAYSVATQNPDVTNTTITQAQIEAQQKAEAEAKRKKVIMWVIIGIIALFLIILTIYLVRRNSAKNKTQTA